jgi:PAS domain S-box-containing protein
MSGSQSRAHGLPEDSVSNPLQAMFDQAAIGMCQTDCRGNFVALNAAFCRMLGRSEEEALRLTVAEITHPADIERTRQLSQEALESGQPFFVQKRYLRPDGSFIWSFTQVTLIRDEAGNPHRFLVVAQDIHDQKMAEEARRRRDERFRLAQKTAGTATWEWDIGKDRISWEEHSALVYGRPFEGFHIKEWMESIHPDDRRVVRHALAAALRGDAPYDHECRVIWPDGRIHWVLHRGEVVRDEQGKPTSMYGITLDITNRRESELALRETEAALRQSEERRTLAMDAAGIGAWVRDFEKGNATWDDGIKRLFGLPSTFQREAGDTTPFLAPHDRERIDREIMRSRELGVGFDIEFPITRADGERRILRALGRPRPSPSGLAMQMHGIMMDVTELRRAAESLRENEERYRETFELAAVGLAHVAHNGRFLRVNDRLCEIAGYSREELLNIDSQRLTHPDDLAIDLAHLRALNAGHIQRYSMEKRYFHKSGRIVWIYLTVAAARNAKGQTQYFISAIEDISARKENEELVRQGRELLETALAASGTGTFRWNIKTNGVESGRNLGRLFGLEPGKAPRNLDQFIALVHPDDRAEFIERCEACAREGADFEMELRVVRPDGSIHWFYDRGKTNRDGEGRPSHMTGACVDITSRKAAEQDLQASQERWILAQSVVSAGIYDVDLITGKQTWSDENFRLFGFDPVAGVPALEMVQAIIHDDDRHLLSDAAAEIERGADEIEIEFRFGPAEAQRWVSSRGKVFRDSNGKAVRVLGVNYDTTARKDAEEALKRAEKLAVVGRMAASIAHEINNPLEAATNLLYLISLEPALTEETKQFVLEAQHQLERVAHVATQTLRFHRQSTSPTLTRVGDLVDSVATLYKGRFSAAGIELQRRDRGPAELMCFANDLRQVLANLIGNAIDATRDGKILVRTRPATDWRSGRKGVMITVADTGEGMSEHTRKKIFEAFFSTKDNTGTGLGLWVISGIVEKHRGHIKVRSSQNQLHHGTVFTVFLPFVGAEAGQAAHAMRAS